MYVENWTLVTNSVDHLAVENEPTLVQHFWSLSVEEQFYIIWPLLIILMITLIFLLFIMNTAIFDDTSRITFWTKHQIAPE